MKRLSVAVAAFCAILAAPALLAAQHDPAPPAPGMTEEEMQSGSQSTQEEFKDALVGMPVWTSDGQQVGIVSEVVAAPDGGIEALHVTVAEFLGIGGRMVRVGAEHVILDSDRLEIRMTSEELDAMPEVPRDS